MSSSTPPDAGGQPRPADSEPGRHAHRATTRRGRLPLVPVSVIAVAAVALTVAVTVAVRSGANADATKLSAGQSVAGGVRSDAKAPDVAPPDAPEEGAPGDTGTAGMDAAKPADKAAAPRPAAPARPLAAVSATLEVQGNQLLDTCGNRFIVRGSETFLGSGIDVGGSPTRLVEEMVSTGVNAVRLIPSVNSLSLTEIDRFLTAAAQARVVVFFTPRGGNAWFNRSDVKTMLKKHEKWLIIDAFGEAPYDDRDRWQNDVQAGIREIRSFGYTVPVVVLANRFGRDLPSLFERGPEIVATDPLRNTILGWQAYWGVGGFYQGEYGMSLAEGIRRSAQQPFPVQIGIDHFADPGQPMDYPGAMVAAQQNNVGWLWWDWYNPFGRTDNLTEDGTAERLTAVGEEVINTHPAGIRATARKACGE